jgi:signal transduction histidine kinase
VLVLYSDERLLPANMIVDEAIRATFVVGTSNRLEFYSEFLDVARFPGEEEQQRQRDFFRDKYRERPPDLVIAVSGGALVFLAKHRTDLFAGVPIVYCRVAGDPHTDHLSDAGIAEVPVPDSIAPTLEMMLRLHPDTRQVVVVSGTGPRDRQMADNFRQEMAAFGFTWLTNFSMEELRGELSRVSDHTVVLYLTIFQDAAGKTLTPRQALDAFAPASRAPIYGCFAYLGHGIVGRSMVTFEQIGRKAAQLGVRILAGEDAQAAIRSESYQSAPMVDWRQLQRWGINENRLPPGTILEFRQPSLWESYHWYIIAVGVAVAAQSVLITALLSQRARRRRAEIVAEQQQMNLAHASRLTMVGELTASIAHEIGQPLGAILSNAETAEILLQSKQPRLEEVQQILADIRKDDLRASEVIRRMRELLSKRELELKLIDLNTVTSDVLRLVDGESRRRGVEIEKQLADTLPVVRGDVIHLQQVILNLVLNAMEAMSESNRRLTMRTTHDNQGNIEVAVEDSGPGIPPEQLPRLFDSFFTTKTHGMGLGLSIVRSIVEAHGGGSGGALLEAALTPTRADDKGRTRSSPEASQSADRSQSSARMDLPFFGEGSSQQKSENRGTAPGLHRSISFFHERDPLIPISPLCGLPVANSAR